MKGRAAAALLAGVAALGAAPEEPAKVTPRPLPHLEAPGDLPLAARDALALKMRNHANDLEWLFAAVLMLNHDLAEQAATGIADTPRRSRPLPGYLQSLNALLPKRFFELQEQLAQRARAVAAAAHAKDDREMSRAMGRLTETCVQCHSVYLHGRGAEPANTEDDNTAPVGR